MRKEKALLLPLQGPRRRFIYVGVYETLAIIIVTLAFIAGDRSAAVAGGVAVGSSTIAVIWNYIFNTLFERWEARQAVRGRNGARRVLHALGFEGGLTLWLVPFMAWMLGVSLWQALLLDLGLLAFFLVYTFVFTWAFDHLFGLPAAAA